MVSRRRFDGEGDDQQAGIVFVARFLPGFYYGALADGAVGGAEDDGYRIVAVGGFGFGVKVQRFGGRADVFQVERFVAGQAHGGRQPQDFNHARDVVVSSSGWMDGSCMP